MTALTLTTPTAVRPPLVPMALGLGARSAPEVASDGLHIGLPELLGLLGVDDEQGQGRGERFQVLRMPRGSTLVREGAPADMLYIVLTGSFKYVKTAEDGYEHVLGFAWRRDVIGYDGLAAGAYVFAAVALEDSRVVALPLAGSSALRRRVEALDRALQCLIARQVAHAGEIAEVMAAVAADARLARFLVQLSARMAERGQSPRRLLLRMSRRDIASYLGLAHETISRSFRLLAEAGCLRVADRDVEIIDLDALERRARNTRGVPEPQPAARVDWPCAA